MFLTALPGRLTPAEVAGVGEERRYSATVINSCQPQVCNPCTSSSMIRAPRGAVRIGEWAVSSWMPGSEARPRGREVPFLRRQHILIRFW